MVKEKEYDEAARIFQTTNVQITTEGRRLPGAALGTATFTENFVGDRVAALEQELDTLAKVAQTQPQAAHSALVHGLASKWLYLARTIPEVSEELQPLENSLHQRLIPAITGRDPSSNMERFASVTRSTRRLGHSQATTSRKLTTPCLHVTDVQLDPEADGKSSYTRRWRARAQIEVQDSPRSST